MRIFFIHNLHFQGQMCTKTTKSPTDLFWKQSYLKQHEYQGNFAWLKRKQEIQSLKTKLYYTTFEQFDSFMAAPKHKEAQLHWLPFPWSPAEAVLCSDNTNTEHHWAPHHSQWVTERGIPCHSSLHDALRESLTSSQKVYQIIKTHYCLVKAPTIKNSLPLASKLSIKFQCD